MTPRNHFSSSPSTEATGGANSNILQVVFVGILVFSMNVYEGRGRLQVYWRRLRSFHYRVPPPKESITEFRESPLENEHTGSAGICYSPCVIRRRSIVTLDGNGTKRKAAWKP